MDLIVVLKDVQFRVFSYSAAAATTQLRRQRPHIRQRYAYARNTHVRHQAPARLADNV